MIKYFLLCISAMLLGCSGEEKWFSSNYFLGLWEYEERLYICCDTCTTTNYETVCQLWEEPFYADMTFFDNGECIRKWRHTENEQSLIWCYNSNTKELMLKEEGGSIINVKDRLVGNDIDDNIFLSENTSSSIVQVKILTRK